MAAGHYGSALEALINLNRFTLYQQFHVKLPPTTKKEQEMNGTLADLLRYEPETTIDYEHPVTEAGTDPKPTA